LFFNLAFGSATSPIPNRWWQLNLQVKKKDRKQRTQNALLFDKLSLLQFFIGIFAAIMVGRYYWKTLIDEKLLVICIVTIGAIFSFLTINLYKKKLNGDFNLKNHIVVNFIFYGFVLPAIFLSINFHLTDMQTQTIKTLTVVKESSYHRYSNGLYINVSLNGFEKMLTAIPEELKADNKPRLFSINIAKGFFGLTVVKSISVTN